LRKGRCSSKRIIDATGAAQGSMLGVAETFA
jgi:hypothetical protein